MSKRSVPKSRGVASMAPGNRGFDTAADKVWTVLELRGWSISDLAGKSGVSRVSLSYWLNGERPLRADYLLAILAALGMEITLKG